MKKLIIIALAAIISPVFTVFGVSAAQQPQDLAPTGAPDGTYQATYARVQSYSAASVTFTAISEPSTEGSGRGLRGPLYGTLDGWTYLFRGYRYDNRVAVSEHIEAKWAPKAVKPPLGRDLSGKVVSISGYTILTLKTHSETRCELIWWFCNTKVKRLHFPVLYVTAMTVIEDSKCADSDIKKISTSSLGSKYTIQVASCAVGDSLFVKGPAYDINFHPMSYEAGSTRMQHTYPMSKPALKVDVTSVSFGFSATNKQEVQVLAGRWVKAPFIPPKRFNALVTANFTNNCCDLRNPNGTAELGRFSR